MKTRSFRRAAERRRRLRPEAPGSRRPRDADPIVPRPDRNRSPLSFGQQRLWFLDQLDPSSGGYILAAALRLRGHLLREALRESLTEIVRRHEVLRTTFPAEAGQPRQVIAPPRDVAPPLVDLRRVGPERGLETALLWSRRESTRPMDLTRGPLLRVMLLRVGEEEHLLFVALHHIVTDGVSTVLFLRELSALYGAHRHGDGSPLQDLPVQYADFAAWQRQRLSGERLEIQLRYWSQRLAGAPEIFDLPTDRPRPAARLGRGRQERFDVPMADAADLETLARRVGSTLFITQLAIFSILLHRLTGSDDIVVGTPVSGRSRQEVRGLIGFFVNTLVLRLDLAGDPTALELLERLKRSALEAYAHQEVPFERLVEALRPPRHLGHTPVFQVMFGVEGDAGVDLKAVGIPGLEGQLLDLERRAVNFDLSLSVQGSPGGFNLVADYPTDLFDATTVARWLRYFRRILRGTAACPDRPLSRLELLGAGERSQVTSQWNDTLDTVHPPLVPEAFAEVARRHPQRCAVVSGGHGIAYGDLRRDVSALARRLRARSVGPGTRVGIHLERSPVMVTAILAVLEAGGCFVPLDPEHPRARLDHVVRDAGVSLLITDSQAPPPGPADVELLDPRDPGDTGGRDDGVTTAPPLHSEHLAYTLYTSGSTGRPKGVEISHRGLASFLAAMARRPGLTSRDVVLAVTTLSFDIALLEILLPLVVGGQVVLATAEEARDGHRLAARLAASGATVLQATPATWRQLLEAGWTGSEGLRALSGGEALPQDLAARLLAAGTALWNLYGPTEATVWTSVRRIRRSPADVTLGRPIANTSTHVLDRHLRPSAIGVAGELHIGGAGLARGYRRLSGRTAACFLPDPFSDRPGARLYRTGDRCRRLPSGEVDFLGRLDAQVKVHGFRIELGEIEAHVRSHPAVHEVAVKVWQTQPGEGRLVAYVVSGSPGSGIDRGDLEEHLRRRLPGYMVPRQWVSLPALPLTPNGKTDRRALPDPEGSPHDKPRVAPRDPEEEALVAIWTELLDQEIGVEDDFFELGGHSLAATRLLSSVRETFGVEISVRSFFETPRIDALADKIRGARARSVPRPRSISRVRRGTGDVAQLLSRVEPSALDEAG